MSTDPRQSWWRTFEARLLLGALLLRLLYLSTILTNPYFTHPVTDEALYDLWGQTIAAGDVFIKDYPYYDSPLHAFYLGLLYWIFGHSFLIVRLVQIAFGTLNVLILYRIAQRLFEPTTAQVAGILAGAYAPFLYYEGLLLKESFALFLMDWALLLILGALERRTWLAFWSAGVVVGLEALSRVNALALIPACLIAAWMTKDGRRSWTTRLAPLALVLGAIMAIAPATIRNWLVSGDFVPITVSGGQVLYTANNPANTTGDLMPVPFVRATSAFERIDFHRRAETETGRRMSPAQVSAHWREKSLAFALEHPGTMARMVAHRVAAFWNREERPDNHSIEQFQQFSWLLRLPLPGYWLIAPLALLGLFLLRNRWRELSVLYILLGVYLLSLLPFWVTSRYRLPIVGVLVLFAAAGMTHLTRLVRTNRRAACKPAAGLAAMAVICWWPMTSPQDTGLERNLAYAYEQNGRFDDAIAIYERLKKIERNPENDLYLANALGLANRTDEALAILDRLSAPQQPADLRQRAFNFRGDLARHNKQWEEAEQAYRAALLIDPGDYGAWNNLAIVLINEKRFSDAEAALTESIRLAPEDALARTNLDALHRYLRQQSGAR